MIGIDIIAAISWPPHLISQPFSPWQFLEATQSFHSLATVLKQSNCINDVVPKRKGKKDVKSKMATKTVH